MSYRWIVAATTILQPVLPITPIEVEHHVAATIQRYNMGASCNKLESWNLRMYETMTDDLSN